MTKIFKELQVLENVEIIDIASEGKCIAKHEELVLFIKDCVPGDIVDVEIFKKKKNLAEARIIKYHKKSDKRAVVFCDHFGTCGGCKWQHLQYEYQLAFKQKQVVDSLERIAKLPYKEFLPILGSSKQQFYRNKLEFTFANKRWIDSNEEVKEKRDDMNPTLGFHVPKRFDKILQIEKCHLQSDPSNEIRNKVYAFSIAHNFSFYDLREQHGLLRNLIIRNTSTGELMVIVVFGANEPKNISKMMEFLFSEYPNIQSLLYIINLKKNDTITDQELIIFKGRDHIFEEMEGLKFKIGAKSFYQTNSYQAYELYKITRNFANFKGDELVYDLYTGAGTIANFVAAKVRKVIGVEYVQSAIEDAKINSEINQIKNTEFYAGDMKDVLNDAFIAQHGKPDVIITDPPRAGMHADVVNKILEIGAEKVIYVSCNPATQARDLIILDAKYAISKVQPVDMFPHTEHVENVVLLELK